MPASLPPTLQLQAQDPQALQADSASSVALQPVTLPVIPPAALASHAQADLIHELDRLNAQTDALIQQQPSPGSLYQQQLAAIFPQVHRPIDPNRIFYSRYQEDAQGQKQLISCEPLGSLLKRLHAPDAEAYLAQEAGAFYRHCNTLEQDQRLSPTGSTANLAAVFEIAITVSLNTFWRSAPSTGPNREQQLVALRRQVLAHQLALRTVDGTLSAKGRTLADDVLKYPSAAAREQAFTPAKRPAVYRLALEDGSEFAGAFILSYTAATLLTGSVMLYSPSEEFEEFESLARLNETVAARLQQEGAARTLLLVSLPQATRAAFNGVPVLAANPTSIDADVIAASVRAVQIRQHFSVRQVLRNELLPSTSALDLAADLTPLLDIAQAFVARSLRLLTAEPVWLQNADQQDQARYRQLEKQLIDTNEALAPLLERILTLEAFAQEQTDKVLKRQHPAYADIEIAPYASLVRLRVSTSARSAEATGYRDEHTGTVYISEDPKINIAQALPGKTLTWGTWRTQVVVDLRTLASYAQRNVDPWSVHGVHRTISATASLIDTRAEQHGTLSDVQLRALAQEADIGQKYAAYLRSAFSPSGAGSTFAAAWQRASAAQMDKDALECRLNPDAAKLITFQTPGSGLDWISVITQHPDSTTRPRVSGFEIEANLLVLGAAQANGQGGQVIHRVLVIQRKGTKPGGVSLLYTPDAPDDVPLRELVNGLAELDTLKAKPEWQAYFTPQMATQDAQEIKRIFNDTRSVYRYTLTPVTGDLNAYLYSAQLGFQLAQADYRSRSNAQIYRESAVNAFMFGVEAADFLLGLLPGKATLSLLRRSLNRGLGRARQLGQRIQGVVKKIERGQAPRIALSGASIRPLEPAWLDVTPYRLPTGIDPLFDVEAFAQKHHYALSRTSGSAPYFFDKHNNQLIAMRDEAGDYHLFQSYVDDGVRYVKDPARNRMDFIVVPDDVKSWKPRFHRHARGGGSVLGTLSPLTVAEQVDADLIAVLRLHSTEGEMRFFDNLLTEIGANQKHTLLANARQGITGAPDEGEFRRMVSASRNLRPGVSQDLRTATLTLRRDLQIYDHINKSTRGLSPPLLSPDKEKLFKKIKKMVEKQDDPSRRIQASIAVRDPHTDVKLLGYAITQKHVNALKRFNEKYRLSTWSDESLNAFLDEKGRRQVLNKIAADHNLSPQAALDELMSSPTIKEALAAFRKTLFKARLEQLQVASYSGDFKKTGVPYIALSRGHASEPSAGVNMVDSDAVTAFEKELPRYSMPFEFDTPRVQKPKPGKPAPKPGPATVPAPTPARGTSVNVVTLDELAQTQKALLPTAAKAKLEEIIQDIEAGRVSRKKIGSYTYVDIPQVEAGSGRGLWRVALEKAGKHDAKDHFIVRGIYDYHGGKTVAWGV